MERAPPISVPESTILDVLGVKLDTELTFKAHVRDLAYRASRNVGIVRKAARVFQDHSISLTCVRSLCCPCLSTVHQFGDRLVSHICLFVIEWHVVQSLCAEDLELVT